MTLDGVFDHTAGLPDAEIHEHYKELLDSADAILYGRITYGLMEFWRTFVENPSGEKSMDEFALAIDRVPKIVFSNTLTAIDWNSARLSNLSLEEEVSAFKKQSGSPVFVGGRSLIIQLMKLNLIDELQLCIYPVIAGSGSLLFENLNDRKLLELVNTKTFSSGAVIHYYKPQNA